MIYMQGPLSGRGKPAKQTPEETNPINMKRKLYIFATGVVVCIAVLLVVIGSATRGDALQRCERVIFSPQRDACLDTLASMENNATACRLVSDAQLRASCITGIAEGTVNASMCKQLASNYEASCISHISNATRNASYCGMIGAPYNSTCIYGVARLKGFTSGNDCLLIGNATLKSECTYLNDYRSAGSSNNASYCAKLPNMRNLTLLSAIFATNSPEAVPSQLMSFSEMNATPQNYCYYNLALQTHNESLCNLTSITIGNMCRYTLLKPANSVNASNINITMCSKLPAGMQPMCEYGMLSAQAVKSKNVSICLQLNSSSINIQYQYSCISAFAMRQSETSRLPTIGLVS